MKLQKDKLYSIQNKIYKIEYSIYNKDLHKVLYCLMNIKNRKDYFYSDINMQNLYKYNEAEKYLKIKDKLHLIKIISKLHK